MKTKFIKAHMQVAEIYSKLSTAKRLQVGSIIVKDDRIISIGYNGTPSGWDNNCEDKCESGLKTKSEVIHAESNSISKLAKSHESGDGASIFITHAPCLNCAKMIYQAGIKEVYYKNTYKSEDGLEFLKKCGIYIERVEI